MPPMTTTDFLPFIVSRCPKARPLPPIEMPKDGIFTYPFVRAIRMASAGITHC